MTYIEMTYIKEYHEPDGTQWLDGDTGGEPRKIGYLVPKSKPNLFTALGDAVKTLSVDEIRKIIDDPAYKSGRNLFPPDWTKDQNGRGACNGYAEAAALERNRVRRGQDHIRLSGDFAYSLMNGGQDRGSMLADGMRGMMQFGDCTEETVKKHGLVHEYRKNRFPQECFTEAARFKGFECYRLDTEAELYTALALGFDCVVAVQAGGSGGLDRNGIVQWGNGMGNHAVCVDGLVYDTQLGGFKVDMQNSWAIRWGDNGRCYLTFDRQLRVSIRTADFYATRSALDDPDGDNPPAPVQ